MEAEPDGQRRRALRPAVPVRLPRTAATPSATSPNICGVSGTSGGDSCNLFQPGVAARHAARSSSSTRPGRSRSTLDKNNFGAERRRGVDATGASRVPGPIMGDGDFVVRGGYARSFSRPAIGDFTAVFNTNPGITIPTRSAARRMAARQRRVGAGCSCATRAAATPPPFTATPTYPILPTSVTRRRCTGFDPNIQMPYADYLPGRHHALARQEHGARSALRRHARPRATGAGYNYNEQSTSRERVPERVPPGAGEPAGEHRRRERQHVRLHRRARHQRRCRSSWRYYNGLPAGERGQRRDLHRRRT